MYRIYKKTEKDVCSQPIAFKSFLDSSNNEQKFFKYAFKEDIRRSVAVNDKSKQRKNGRSLPRRTCTARPTDKKYRCKFQFTIRSTEDPVPMYFVVGGCGTEMHSHHLKHIDTSTITRRKSIIPRKCHESIIDFSKYCIYNSLNRSKHLHKYGFFMSLDQIRDIVKRNISVTDNKGELITDLPTFLKTVSNLRYSILYHNAASSVSQYLSKRIQDAISTEPNDIQKDLKTCRKKQKELGEKYYYAPSTQVNKFSPISDFNNQSFDALSQDDRILDVLEYLDTDESELQHSSKESFSFIDLDEKYKKSQCLNLNTCISDDVSQKASIINSYLSNEEDSDVSRETEMYSIERRKVLKLKDHQKLLINAAYITEPDYEYYCPLFKSFDMHMFIQTFSILNFV